MEMKQMSQSDGLRIEVDVANQEITLHVAAEGIAMLREALDDAEAGGKVLIGEKPLLIIRPVGWKPAEEETADEIVRPGTYELNNGRTLHIWLAGTDEQPELWACTAYDHGPMCRLCREVDGVLNACLVNVIDGRMECDQDETGEFRFKTTQAGIDAVRHMLKPDDPDDPEEPAG